MSKASIDRVLREAHKHYATVLMQQGRVPLDEELNDKDVRREIQRIIRLTTKVLTAANLRKVRLGVLAGRDINGLMRKASEESGQSLNEDDVSVLEPRTSIVCIARAPDPERESHPGHRATGRRSCARAIVLAAGRRMPGARRLVIPHAAVARAKRGAGRSAIGRCISAEATASRTLSHQTTS